MDGTTTSIKLNNDRALKIIISPKLRIYRHAILIVIIWMGFSHTKADFIEPINTYIGISRLAALLLVVYINMYVFVPKLLLRDKYLGYFLWSLVLFCFSILMASTSMHLVSPHYRIRSSPLDEDTARFFAAFMFVIVMGASAAVKLFQRWVSDSQRIVELETNTIFTELENLKKQINPHFLFNTLNNVNILTQIDPEKASQIIIKLSDLLRYQLYDSARNMVLLSSEIHFLEDFLNLEKIRRDHFEFSIKSQGTISGIDVPPLLFITFIENAVKHNMDAEDTSFINVFFAVTNGQLNFMCINSKPRIRVESGKQGGLGLANVKRRLELLYPGKHTLAINDTHYQFNVCLTINL